MAAPYRGFSGVKAWSLTIIVLISVVVMLGVISVAVPYEKVLGGWIFALATLPMLLGFVIGFIVDYRIKKRRMGEIARRLEARGLTVKTEPDGPTKAMFNAHFETLEPMLDLRTGTSGLEWVAYSRDVLLFEHEYVTGSGKHMQVHSRTVLAHPTDAVEPKNASIGMMAAILAVRPRVGEARAYRMQAGDDLTIGDAVFDKCWCVYGAEATGRKFLNDSVRQELMKSPRGETWIVGGGWVLCASRWVMTAPNLEAFIDRTRRVIELAG